MGCNYAEEEDVDDGSEVLFMEVETPKAQIDGNSDFANSQKLVQLFKV